MSRATTLCVAVLTLLSLPATATIINIPDDFGTIQEGIDASVDGDTVLVQPGTYFENINFNGHNIAVGSLFLTTGERSYISNTIIDADQTSGSVVTFENGEDNSAIITGFIIQNGSTPGFPNCGGGIKCLQSNPTISDNIIINNSASGEWGEPWPMPNGNGGGIYCSGFNPVIINNIIAFNQSNSWAGGIGCNCSNPEIRNNTVYANSAVFSAGGIDCDGTDGVIINTILWGNTPTQLEVNTSSPPAITYCDIEGGWEGEGNIDCDPFFCDPENGDFQLAENSCCVGAGENGVDIGALGVGCETTDIDENHLIPYSFSLAQNYPNPFNASTSISFSLPEPGDVRLVVYDLLGRQVCTLLDDYRPAGMHRVTFDASDFSSGVYFYRVQAGDMVETKRMLLLN